MVIKEIGNNDILKENYNNGLALAFAIVYQPEETGFQLFFGPAMTITGFNDSQADKLPDS
ncbi:hypothetical protein [Photorhabdus heterorhabditis]|uniref:hypothetical protein n=1 Tax=Photorhabdus heterorhabditis TaxID=880156 RepID=UPI0015623FDC|nr:hypothetical protein [Photorhabdus heterorhabditis]MBS9444283.1 hypothetical protein [Photorhabdus heterorhabditis]NRN30542.1 hypothetical protein [Photorhabdus heterorhabditis subsp. aluminescens]